MKQLILLIILYNFCMLTALLCGRASVEEDAFRLGSWQKFLAVLGIMFCVFMFVLYQSIRKL